MLVAFLSSVLLLLLKFIATDADNAAEVPLEIIWQVATHGDKGCEQKYGVPIDVQQYGMLVNSDPGTTPMVGELVNIFYTFGRWPYIDKATSAFVNGGLPQLGNLTAHLEEVEKFVKKRVPDPEFSGLGVIDFETWFAIADMNFRSGGMGKYRDESFKLAKKEHQNEGLDDKELRKIADEDFNRAARNFFEKTLLKVTEMRPRGKWGYYIYPKCNYRDDLKDCKQGFYDWGKQLDWLVQASGAMYPSVYFKPTWSKQTRSGKVKSSMKVTRQWLDYAEEPHKPIYVYTSTVLGFDEGGVPDYYDDFDLISSLGVAADMGANGLVMWSTTNRRSSVEQCQREKAHVDKQLGPYVKRLLDFFGNCARDLCNSNGRCAKNYVEVDPTKMNTDLDKDHVYDIKIVKELYHCRCYKGWDGQYCTEME